MNPDDLLISLEIGYDEPSGQQFTVVLERRRIWSGIVRVPSWRDGGRKFPRGKVLTFKIISGTFGEVRLMLGNKRT